MKKKFAILLVVLLALAAFASCEKNYEPDPAVEAYLNSGLTAQKAFDKISDCSYSETLSVQNKKGEEQGRRETTVTFDVSDKDNLSFTMEQTFSGSLVENGVTEQLVTLTKQGDGYIYKTVTNVELQNTEKTVDNQFATDLVASLVYTDNGMFSDSGLYYGDVFMLKIYKYPAESFHVDTEADLCVFDEKIHVYRDDEVGDVRLYQTTKVNRLGLLVYDYEKYESVNKDYVMVSELSVSYNYVQAE